MNIDDKINQQLLHAFVWGWKYRVQAEVYIRNPKTLDKAARIAFNFDELLQPQKKLGWDQHKVERKKIAEMDLGLIQWNWEACNIKIRKRLGNLI